MQRKRVSNYDCRINVTKSTWLKVRKNGQQKSATCLATLLHSELNSNVARFITNIKPLLQQIRLLTDLSVGGKTRNVAIQLVLQQCCKTNCTFFNLLPVNFYAPLPKRFLQVFLFNVILTISYLRARTIETSSLPTDSMRPLFKQMEIFSVILTVYFNCKYFP